MPQPLSFQRRKRKNAGDIELGKRDAGVYLGRRRLLPLHHHRPRCLWCHPPRCGQRLARPGHAPPCFGSPPWRPHCGPSPSVLHPSSPSVPAPVPCKGWPAPTPAPTPAPAPAPTSAPVVASTKPAYPPAYCPNHGWICPPLEVRSSPRGGDALHQGHASSSFTNSGEGNGPAVLGSGLRICAFRHHGGSP